MASLVARRYLLPEIKFKNLEMYYLIQISVMLPIQLTICMLQTPKSETTLTITTTLAKMLHGRACSMLVLKKLVVEFLV